MAVLRKGFYFYRSSNSLSSFTIDLLHGFEKKYIFPDEGDGKCSWDFGFKTDRYVASGDGKIYFVNPADNSQRGIYDCVTGEVTFETIQGAVGLSFVQEVLGKGFAVMRGTDASGNEMTYLLEGKTGRLIPLSAGTFEKLLAVNPDTETLLVDVKEEKKVHRYLMDMDGRRILEVNHQKVYKNDFYNDNFIELYDAVDVTKSAMYCDWKGNVLFTYDKDYSVIWGKKTILFSYAETGRDVPVFTLLQAGGKIVNPRSISEKEGGYSEMMIRDKGGIIGTGSDKGDCYLIPANNAVFKIDGQGNVSELRIKQ